MRPVFFASLALLAALGTGACGRLTGHAQAAQPETATRQVVRLESTVLNLADPGNTTFVRLGVSVALGPTPVVTEGTNEALVSGAARDTVVQVTSARTAEEILTPEGKAALKQAIQAELQRRLPQYKVEEIYFDEFLVQH